MVQGDTGTLIADQISLSNMKEVLKEFSALHRYTGTEDGEASVRYMEKWLERHGVPYETIKYPCFRSLPKQAFVEVPESGKQYAALAAVFSGEAKKLTGEVYFDALSMKEPLTEIEELGRMENFKGKIVLTYARHGDFAYKASRAGALAVVNIWLQDEELLHHNTIGTVWGNPTLENFHRHCYLPFLGVTNSSGKELIALYEKGGLKLSINIEMDNQIVESSMPMVDIKGKSEKYVLISGHYDSWYEGITDNGTANAVMLECARILQQNKDQLERSVKIIWWSGHSDGRYAGSAWYVDNHWESLNENCVAHVNLDLVGGKNNEIVLRGTSQMEKAGFVKDIIEQYTGARNDLDHCLGRAGDESFSGVGVPLNMLSHYKSFPDGEYAQWANIYAPWWHTVEDGLDKVDDEFFLREAKINLKLAWDIIQSEVLPVDMSAFAARMVQKLEDIQEKCTAPFCLNEVVEATKMLGRSVTALEREMTKLGLKGEAADDIIKTVAGGMVRLVYTCGSPYEHDPAYAGRSDYHPFQLVQGVDKNNTTVATLLMLKTDFTRQCTRQKVEIQKLIDYMDRLLQSWS